MKPAWVVLLVGLTAAVFHTPATKGEFLFYDDQRFVVLNKEIEEIGNPLRFLTDLDTTAQREKPTKDIYRPLRTFTFAVANALWGKDNPAAWHGLSVLLHALCAALLAWLLLAAGFSRWPAAAGALFFALHPVTVETTAWICSLGDSLCGVFVLASMLLWHKDRRILAHVALLFALLGKEHAVVVPGLWLAWDFFLRPERVRSRTLAQGALPGLVLVIGFLVFRSTLGSRMSQLDEPLGGSHLNAVLTMLSGLGWYAATVLFPFGSTFDARVEVQESLTVPVLLGTLVLGALVYGLFRGPRRSRLACAWFLMALVPVSNIIVPLKIPTADRFLYIPLMGLAFLAADLARRTAPASARLAPIALLLLGVVTTSRIGDWRDDASLIAAGKRVNLKSKMLLWAEASFLAKNAVTFLNEGSIEGMKHADEAEELYEKYIKNSVPIEQTQAFIELGKLYFAVGRWRVLHDPRGDWRSAYREAMRAYLRAWEYQKRGIGRVIEAEMRHVAKRLVQLSVALAEQRNKALGQTIAIGLQAMHYLTEKHGFDDRLARAKLRFVDSVVIRGEHPDKAREGFDYVLATVAALKREGGRNLTYLHAQALFFRSILLDQDDRNRHEMEDAYQLYLDAANTNRSVAIQALIYAARAAVTHWKSFGDVEWRKRAIRLLENIPTVARTERLMITAEQQAEIDGLLRELGQPIREPKKRPK